jgi:recombination protein RecT
MALPAHISPDRFIRVVITAVQLNPDLLTCDRGTLWNACMRCANDGLLPDGTEAALVPYKSKVQYIPMYQGLLKKFRNSGEFKWITAGLVYENDEYDHWIDETGEHFRHKPADDHDNKKLRRVYALATTKDGGSFIADMSLSEVNKRKAMSRTTREDAPWKAWPDEMMKKTALRVLSKLLPKSSDLDALMQRDEGALLGVESVDDRRQAVADADAGSALQQFAQQEAEQEAPAPEPQPAAASPTPEQPAQAEPELDLDPAKLKAAFDRGREERRQGVRRNKPPGELRDPARAQELASWHDGWDSVGPEEESKDGGR